MKTYHGWLMLINYKNVQNNSFSFDNYIPCARSTWPNLYILAGIRPSFCMFHPSPQNSHIETNTYTKFKDLIWGYTLIVMYDGLVYLRFLKTIWIQILVSKSSSLKLLCCIIRKLLQNCDCFEAFDDGNVCFSDRFFFFKMTYITLCANKISAT